MICWRQNAKSLAKQSVKSKKSSAVRDVLEPCALRGARTVLRGLVGSNALRLPDCFIRTKPSSIKRQHTLLSGSVTWDWN